MSVCAIPMICYYNGKILRTETYTKYVGNKAVIVPFDVPVDCMFEQFGDIRKLLLCLLMYRLIACLNSLVI